MYEILHDIVINTFLQWIMQCTIGDQLLQRPVSVSRENGACHGGVGERCHTEPT